ncbi:sterol desaturase family protein [Pseudolabrys sp. FHR47]|uniref:sterol desaturase family protein n=1 Tax=Pseudolabrys sp. FHR47 TaxID=2562284 RepID=UPI0010BE6CB1|nr:sterol desaturase family protein [Pseudolabrys sp. FHR47]
MSDSTLPADTFSPLRNAISWLAWPGLLTISIAIMAYGFTVEMPALFFNIAYLLLALCLYGLEQWMPHERVWNENDGQTFANIAHTLTSKGVVQAAVVFSTVIGISSYVTPAAEPGYSIWPRSWPMWTQVILAIAAAEFGLYWGHRIAHEWPWLWRFHAVHHSVTRLWIVNTGRFHFVDSFKSIGLGMAILLALGAPMEVLIWLSAITAFVGMLTHCNVDMKFGPLSWWFNTPELHRWHHSKDLREGNKNYSENIMLWDHVFGTFYNARDYRPPVDIGIQEEMPAGFLQQLAWPFRRRP